MSQFHPIIEVIEEDYYIPELDASRKISALLPYNYYQSDEDYPVLYLQDGQNLFNPKAPFGDWAIDRTLEAFAARGQANIIVIAIDHGEEERIREYLPYYHTQFGDGQGQFYIQFMKDKLIPYVQKKYRVKTGYEHTGIGGSSMGGLISLYGGLTEPGVFGKMMIFSPSLWVSNMIFHHATVFKPLNQSRIYLYAGGQESKVHLPNVNRLAGILRKKAFADSYFDIELSLNMEGQHAEYFWSIEFPRAVKWLYFNEQNHEV